MTDRYAEARAHLRDADPVMARLIEEHPSFDPRAWMKQLPMMDAFGALCSRSSGSSSRCPPPGRFSFG